ncbi:tRNA dihydrouridine(20/20a) synthase DusA [Thermomonas sp.]|uniref:tRNA dihydrouridine(20/20a) synthase DusA n=1 Tax=Thermomonas sp. TaxID=1971895 RepID=UPI002CEBB2AF|nr:tRNA dihydrouridine(20/20a) synthase DusA [Thermomonas sp.]HRO64081.1 tRNA dihydrouridine(20/20a) synthase DusA [Thermomonas sp.]
MAISAAIPAEQLRLSVAPMMDWTDSHCRVFHRLLAPHARLYSEMVHANAVIHGDRARLLMLDPVEHPVALQLGGSEPVLLAQAARIGAEHGFDEINLNCGCPSDRVQAGRFGACLMREPALVAESVAAMIAAVPELPITVKCRLGVDDDHEWEHFLRFIDTIAEAGCRLFVVHARNAWLKGLSPKENREVPPLRYDWAYRLKRERPALQVIVNGGIAGAGEATAHLDHVDGAMLGRAAYHTPYLLHELDVRWFGNAVHGSTSSPRMGDGSPRMGESSPRTELRSRAEVLRAYRPYVEAQLARGVLLKHITRHLLGLFSGQPGGRAFRQILSEGAHQPGADWALVERALSLTEREPITP